MSSSSIRFGLPKELADEIDSLVGPRKRSLFVCEAIREKLHQRDRMENICKSLAEAAGGTASRAQRRKAKIRAR